MKNIVLFLGSVLLLSIVSCTNSGEKLSMQQADSVITAQSLYALPPGEFTASLDSLRALTDQEQTRWFFLAKAYAYNLNHCLEMHDTAIRDLNDYRHLVNDNDLNHQELSADSDYRAFLLTWLDLTAKYHIAEGQCRYTDQMFIMTQWDLAKSMLEGDLLDFALWQIMEQQVSDFGIEIHPGMLDEFHELCTDALYRAGIDSLLDFYHGIEANAEVYTYHADEKDTLAAYVFKPEGREEPGACIVIAHGGGWYLGQPLERNHISRIFNKLGVTAVCIEYRIKGRTDDDPVTAMKDTRAAIRWVRENASMLNIDPGRVIISGMSAGGHLAAATAVIQGFEHPGEDLTVSSDPDAAILWSACVDPTVDHWFRYCMGRMTDETAYSPLHNVDAGEVPVLIFQGTNDEFLDYHSQIAFRDKMVAEGNWCKLVLFEGLSHTQVYEQDMTEEYMTFLGMLED